MDKSNLPSSLTPAEMTLLQAAKELLKSLFKTRDTQKLSDVDTVGEYLQLFYADKRDREYFSVMYVDAQYRLIEHELHSMGTLTHAPVYPSAIAKKSLELSAAGVILAHNHPSDVATISDRDVEVTDRVISALGLIDVKVIDHFVVGETVLSMKREQKL